MTCTNVVWSDSASMLKKFSMPQFQHQQIPELERMIGASLQMLLNESPDLRRVKIPAFERLLRKQRVPQQLPQGPAEPLSDRDAESHLAPVDVLRGQQIGERQFEQMLQP